MTDTFAVESKLQPKVRAGNTKPVITEVSKILKSLPTGPFHQVLKMEFTNPPDKVARYFDRFLRKEKKRFEVAAVYTETNDFSINPDKWFFDVFAYCEYGGHKDYMWLGDWESDVHPSATLKGMERLQAVYASDAFHDEVHEDARELCSLLVVCKFQDLIRRSVPLMKELAVPLLATAHDYVCIAEFRK